MKTLLEEVMDYYHCTRLSVPQVCGHGFESGDLGPGTIVGSAAFNMFVIIGICVWVIPNGEVRKIKHLRVFFITAFWSIFAYIWLYLILAIISPGTVEVWRSEEGGVLRFVHCAGRKAREKKTWWLSHFESEHLESRWVELE